MLGKLLHTFAHPLAAKTVQYSGSDRIDVFYETLSQGLENLLSCVGQGSPPSFSLECVSMAVDLVRSIHSELHALVEDLWVPVRTAAGMDVLNMYMEVCMRLLDMCNSIKDAMGYLEFYQMSLELALASLASAVKSLFVNNDDIGALGSLEACKNELQRMKSKKHTRTLWSDSVSRLEQGGFDRAGSSAFKKREQVLKRSMTVLSTTPSVDRQALDFSLLMADVQAVVIFISSLILWVLTESSGTFQSPVNLDIGGTNGRVGWSASLLQLREKVQQAQLASTEILRQVNHLQEYEDFCNFMNRLCEEVEGGLRDRGMGIEPGKEDVWLKDCTAMVEQTRVMLAEILDRSEKLTLQSGNVYSEVVSAKKKLLEMCENQLMSRSPTM